MAEQAEHGQLFLQVGDQTAELLEFITNQLDDVELDSIEVDRIHPDGALASEPITIAVIFSISGAAIYAVARAVEKWLENKRQEGARGDLIAAWTKSPALGKALAEMEKTHAKVVIKQGMPDIKMVKQGVKD